MNFPKEGSLVLLLGIALVISPHHERAKPAIAQELLQRNPRVVAALDSWGYQPLYREGWSAKRLFNDATVYGPGGDELGKLKDILLDRRGNILGVIAEVAGFLGIGDTNVFVTWNQVEISPTLRRVYIPVTEENVSDYRATPSFIRRALTHTIRAVDENVHAGRDVWKATELINDYVYLGNRVEYGYVRDLIFDGDGRLYAYVVNADPAWGGGSYALPYTPDAAWDPGLDYYHAPFEEREVRELDPFEYTRMNRNVEFRRSD